MVSRRKIGAIFLLLGVILCGLVSPVSAKQSQANNEKIKDGKLVGHWRTVYDAESLEVNDKTLVKLSRKLDKLQHETDKNKKELKIYLEDSEHDGVDVYEDYAEILNTVGSHFTIYLDSDQLVYGYDWTYNKGKVKIIVPHLSDRTITINETGEIVLNIDISDTGVQSNNNPPYDNFLFQFEANFTVIGQSNFTGVEQTNLTNISMYLKLNEGTGDNFTNDTTINGNNGTLINLNVTGNETSGWSTDCPPGINVSCMLFNGINDSINVPDSASLDISNGWTIHVWIRSLPGSMSGFHRIVGKQNTTDHTNYALAIRDGTTIGAVFNNGSFQQFYENEVGCSDTDINTGEWIPVAGSWNTTHLKLYSYGLFRCSKSFEGGFPLPNDAPLLIGQNKIGGGENWNGSIDEVIIFNIALTDDQIWDLSHTNTQNVTVNSSGGSFSVNQTLRGNRTSTPPETFIFNQTGTDLQNVLNNTWNISSLGLGLVNWSFINNFDYYNATVYNYSSTYVSFDYNVTALQNGSITLRVIGLPAYSRWTLNYNSVLNQSEVDADSSGVIVIGVNLGSGNYELIRGSSYDDLQSWFSNFFNVWLIRILIAVLTIAIVIEILGFIQDQINKMSGDIT